MRNFIIRAFNLAIMAVIAALAVISNCDDGINGPSPNNNGEVDRFLGVKYKVTFNGNGGTVSPSSDTTDANGTLSSLPTPTRSGYTFDGWYTAATGGNEVTTYTVFDKNTTIYARWTLVTYTITFNVNGSGGSVSPTSGKTGDGSTLTSLPTPTRDGYTFDGWFTSATGGTVVTVSRVYTANTTIYAQWTANGTGGGGGIVYGTSVSYGGETYQTVVIGTQTWFARNLNYDVPSVTSDMCYGNSADNCAKYGRLYNWATAMGIDPSYNSTRWNGSDVKHRGICPSGWHLPSDAEWDVLMTAVGGSSTAGTKLKSSQYWQSYSGVPAGTDDYGFSALPGGIGYSDGSFIYVGYYGNWWSATENGATYAWYRDMNYDFEYVYRYIYHKTHLFSVRCVAD